ncbi:hypothetical protein [Mycoplasmopsis pullorum]|uniref:Uncharacterized protein n=1 Tax=Mycoplasmopsis pullorum TaxID=48003 RepID=A0A1L4FSA4_9BACT|nr:hypothetical protein [Mycoplasmopsis pullorum]APJ38501.1 hypothetical protein BLA55_02425 [Mycoplasmopsis pullorum]TNK83763.1 hypothetical protein C4M93_01290 [Mycoplasmopsis pullorum]TNK88202.1 hypothetical protein C4M89_03240 [Mycoplasmopsis pullorum]TNK92566.1 hypothetical protein C4M96_00350 [Mycoplasmopsis pullorum]
MSEALKFIGAGGVGSLLVLIAFIVYYALKNRRINKQKHHNTSITGIGNSITLKEAEKHTDSENLLTILKMLNETNNRISETNQQNAKLMKAFKIYVDNNGVDSKIKKIVSDILEL